MQRAHLVSIVIVTWNSQKHLPTCLGHIVEQTFQDFEIIIVDNGSDDCALDGLQDKYPSLTVQIHKLDTNRGFAVANNIGARLARGTWLALLNADAYPEREWLAKLVEASEQNPHACFASRQIQANAPELLDGEGDVYHISGLAWRRNYGHPVQEKRDIEEIFSPCAAAAIYPRQAFLDAGGFDEDYFSYQEDVDLGFRLRLKGLRCLYVPQAIVHHVGSASTGKYSDFAIYHGHRNLVWTFTKNMPALLFWLLLPLHLFMSFLTILRFLRSGNGKAIYRAKLDAFLGLSPMLQKRKEIQKARQASISSIYRAMEHGLLAPMQASYQRRRLENG